MTIINDIYAIASNGLIANPDFPDVGNVVVGDTTNGDAGTYEPALVATVTLGTQYGEDGTEFTGEYSAGTAVNITIENVRIDAQ